TRAHNSDLQHIAETILRTDADAIALQELTGADQLKILLGRLQGKYHGAVATGSAVDRVEAVLVKDGDSQFETVPAGAQKAASATFRLERDLPPITLISAHADAFKAAQRRSFTGEVVDWAGGRSHGGLVFIAGDLNFEVDAAIQTHFYTDNQKHDSEAYSYILRFLRDLGRDAGDTAINDRRIDYVFGPSEAVFLRRAEVLRNEAVGKMDHWPLVVEVVL